MGVMTQSSDPASGSDESRWFGFRPVEPDRKASMVRQVFDSVAPRYDLMNDLMSMGVHRLWKAALIRQMDPRPGQVLVDVAGGTGDVAFAFLERSNRNLSPGQTPARAVVCDINTSMMAVGRDKAIDRGRLENLDWLTGDAEKLPLPDSCADVYTISFGLRNVTRMDAALAEARRVLRPGGRFFCLEFSKVVLPVLDRLYDLYSFQVLPRLGQLVAGDRESYAYLVESIRRFPDQDTLARRMEQAGLQHVRWRNLSGGIAAVHSGWRI